MVGDSDNRSGKLTPRHHVPMWGVRVGRALSPHGSNNA